MTVIETLRSLGVASRAGRNEGLDSNSTNLAVRRRLPLGLCQPTLLVSCLMVTRGNLDILPYSLACFSNQTWAKRELIVVTGAA